MHRVGRASLGCSTAMPSLTGRFNEPLKPGARFTVPVGEPFTLADSESLVFPRTRGANLLLVGDRDDDETPDLSLRGVRALGLARGCRRKALSATTVDFIGDEEVEDGLTILDVAEAAGSRYVRASSTLRRCSSELAAIVASRTTDGNYRDSTQHAGAVRCPARAVAGALRPLQRGRIRRALNRSTARRRFW